jgi:hypothetical protein
MMIHFVIMDEVPFGMVCQALGLSFVIEYRSEPEVHENWFLPVSVGARRTCDSRYL